MGNLCPRKEKHIVDNDDDKTSKKSRDSITNSSTKSKNI